MRISRRSSDSLRAAGVGVLLGVLLGGVFLVFAHLNSERDSAPAAVSFSDDDNTTSGLGDDLLDALVVPEDTPVDELEARAECVEQEMAERVPADRRGGLTPGGPMPEWVQTELAAAFAACPLPALP